MFACTGGNDGSQDTTDDSMEAPQDTTTNTNEANSQQQATADITAIENSGVSGTATFTGEGEGEGVQIEVNLQGLTPGQHAVHLHTGTCDDIGSHWNPTNENHGQRDQSEQFHRGDIANVEAGNDSTATLTLTADDWTIGGSDSTNVVGRLVIVHAGADDFTSQPSGNAGDMIACGVIQ